MLKPIVTITALLSLSAPAYADVETKARELARLRAEVEDLTAQIEEEKSSTERKLTLLDGQRATLEAEVQQEELRLEQLRAARAELDKRMAAAKNNEEALTSVVIESIDMLLGHMQTGLPFMLAERQAELETLKKDLADGTLLPSAAASRLWSRIEDEQRLTRESGLHRQVVAVGDEELLCDVARLGMVALYFRTPHGRYGQAVKAAGGWRFELLQSAEDAQRLVPLFDALGQRRRVGFYELPNPILTEAL